MLPQGFAVHLAHRLQELASDGTIYVSEAVRRQAAGFFRFDDLGEVTLPEVAQPVRVRTCTQADQAHSRLEAFLDRHTSLASATLPRPPCAPVESRSMEG